MPIALPAHPCADCEVLRDSESHQLADTRLYPAPLLPVAHADATPEPMVELDGIVILQGDAEVVHPSLNIGTDFIVPVVHGDTPTAACESAQLSLEACNGFLRDSEFLPGEGEAEEKTLLSSHHPAFAPVDLNLEDSLKISADTFHHAISGPSGLHQYGEVVGIPCELMPSFLQLLIEVIQKDIAQEGRKWPSLRNSFGRFIEPSVYDHTG